MASRPLRLPQPFVPFYVPWATPSLSVAWGQHEVCCDFADPPSRTQLFSAEAPQPPGPEPSQRWAARADGALAQDARPGGACLWAPRVSLRPMSPDVGRRGGPQRGLQTGEGGASGNSALSPSRRPQTLCTKATMQTVRAADTNEVVKLVFRESDNDRRVSTPGAGHGAPGRGPG